MIQLGRIIRRTFRDTRAGWLFRRYYMMPSGVRRGYDSHLQWSGAIDVSRGKRTHSNDLQDFFDNHTDGNGIWKWHHYFEVYDRHFHKFRGQEVHVLEIGIFSGGSLEMWHDYFGTKAIFMASTSTQLVVSMKAIALRFLSVTRVIDCSGAMCGKKYRSLI